MSTSFLCIVPEYYCNAKPCLLNLYNGYNRKEDVFLPFSLTSFKGEIIMLEETIQAVKAAEKEAAKLVQDAWNESDKIQEAAAKEAGELKEAMRLAASNASKERMQKAKEEGEILLKNSQEASEKQAKAIKDAAMLKEDAAVKAIIAELLK